MHAGVDSSTISKNYFIKHKKYLYYCCVNEG